MPPRYRSVALAALAATITALGPIGCGSAVHPRPGPTVTLALTAPTDQTRVSAAVTTVRGTVSPRGVAVEVLGQRVAVSDGGAFSTRVRLSVGTNLIDVIAAAPRSAGAVAAVRVTRFLLVSVPAVVGDSPAEATAALQALGLRVQDSGSNDPFNALLPGANSVCYSQPSAGARVDPGTTVVVKTSKLCF